MSRDLRSFIETVRAQRPSDIIEIEREVNPRYETAAIMARFAQSCRWPIFCFRHVQGCDFPLVSNVCGSMQRLALALECAVPEVSSRYAQGCRRPIEPRLTSDAPVQQEIRRGDEVDLGTLPSLSYHENDSPNAYITAAIVAARSPDSGKTNLSYHRLMIVGRDKTAIYMEQGRHLDRIYRQYEAQGKPMPAAAFIGVHPLWSLGALFAGAQDVQEYDVIGGLMGEPLDVVPCVTQEDLFVPALAEFVLEGAVAPQERIEEGPFGEFTGYSTGTFQTPIFDVQALTSRTNPIFQDISSGSLEHLLLPLPAMEQHLLGLCRTVAPKVTGVRIAAPLTVFVSLIKSDDAQPRQIIEAVLASGIYAKQVIVLDDDVKLTDLQEVLTALALRVQPDRDVVILKDQEGTPLDPSLDSPQARTSKIGMDATAPLARKRQVQRNRVPNEVLSSIKISDFLK